MSDEEDYNSEEDVDYTPSDGEVGSEEENSGDEEDLSVLADDAGTAANSGAKKTCRKKQKKNDMAPRKRKGGIHLQGEETPAGEANGETGNTELAQNIKVEADQKKAQKEKKRTDDLWSSFLTDVKPKAKPTPKVAPTSTSVEQPTSSSCPDTSAVQEAAETTTATPPSAKPNGKITITTVFDFAGEEIKVTKEVAADSKEAKLELKKQEEQQQEQQRASGASCSAPVPTGSALPSPSSLSAGPALLGVKRPAPAAGGLGSVLNKIGKKNKMGTLDKSKMDWDSFKKREGIEDDLKIHNKGKDGYIERMSFLNRTDHRQFEIERDLRLNRSGKR